MASLTEDSVRDKAKIILGFDQNEKGVQQGTGQITTFNQLGFSGKGKMNKPDGWYLPNEKGLPAIILETKSEDEDVFNPRRKEELLKNIEIISEKYDLTIGILWNGIDIRVFRNGEERRRTQILTSLSSWPT